MVYDANAGAVDRERADAAEKLDELEAIGEPTQYDRGTLTAVRLSRLEPAERKRVEALSVRWAKA